MLGSYRRMLLTATLIAAGATAGPGMADTASIAVVDADGRHDPAVEVSRTFTLAGNAVAPAELYVKHRAAGGAPCASTAFGDSGEYLDDFSPSDAVEINGDFVERSAQTWGDAGPRMFCVWLAAGELVPATPITQVIDFRLPVRTVDVILPAGPIAPLTPFALTLSGTVEAPTGVFASLASPGSRCGATLATDGNFPTLLGAPVEGTFSVPVTAPKRPAGDYTACVWFGKSMFSTAPGASLHQFPVRIGTPGTTANASGQSVVVVDFPRRVRAGQRFVVTLQVPTARVGEGGTCFVQRLAGRSWTTIAGARVDRSARCHISVRLSTRGTPQLRLRVVATDGRVSSSRGRPVRVG